MTSSIFAAPVSENLAPNALASLPSANKHQMKMETQRNLTKENIGHFLFTIAPTATVDDLNTPLPTFLIGYQSAIDPNGIIDAASVEIGGGAMYTGSMNKSKCVWFHPRIMGVKYLNPHGKTRYYASAGTSLMSIIKSNGFYSFYHGTYLGPALAVGVELGSTKNAISRIQLSYDQPVMAIYTDSVVRRAIVGGIQNLAISPNMNKNGVVMASYSVGF